MPGIQNGFNNSKFEMKSIYSNSLVTYTLAQQEPLYPNYLVILHIYSNQRQGKRGVQFNTVMQSARLAGALDPGICHPSNQVLMLQSAVQYCA